ncbi:hypothetical protein GUJ93_ZPchr0002g23168 [Zizania palustris]|uniref:Uncharacterized protein n=1 Tax=Zizania palustris TaxID=103762 RepID=A0A8J5RZ19_ZIZPA|nr:hypothetical protein GUJ93_ZPchr0002g23168 [Zizania palustris]
MRAAPAAPCSSPCAAAGHVCRPRRPRTTIATPATSPRTAADTTNPRRRRQRAPLSLTRPHRVARTEPRFPCVARPVVPAAACLACTIAKVPAATQEAKHRRRSQCPLPHCSPHGPLSADDAAAAATLSSLHPRRRRPCRPRVPPPPPPPAAASCRPPPLQAPRVPSSQPPPSQARVSSPLQQPLRPP